MTTDRLTPLAAGGELKLHLYLINVTPPPRFTRLYGTHDGVLRGGKMPLCMVVLRFVATTYISADQALPEMYSWLARAAALLATPGVAGARALHRLEMFKVMTDRWIRHGNLPCTSIASLRSTADPCQTGRLSPLGPVARLANSLEASSEPTLPSPPARSQLTRCADTSTAVCAASRSRIPASATSSIWLSSARE